MSQIDLHKFRSDLGKKPPLGVNGPPIGIRAKDLDDNFNKVTLISGQGSPPLYRVRYTKDGIIITDLNVPPDGSNLGDLLYWNPQAGEGGAWVVLNTSGADRGTLLVWGGNTWQILNAPQGGDLHVLSVQNGYVSWAPTQDCGDDA
jgi:hypothetical protein